MAELDVDSDFDANWRSMLGLLLVVVVRYELQLRQDFAGIFTAQQPSLDMHACMHACTRAHAGGVFGQCCWRGRRGNLHPHLPGTRGLSA